MHEFVTAITLIEDGNKMQIKFGEYVNCTNHSHLFSKNQLKLTLAWIRGGKIGAAVVVVEAVDSVTFSFVGKFASNGCFYKVHRHKEKDSGMIEDCRAL